MPDVELPCVACRENFVFTEREQEDFYRRNLAQPQRCAKCRPSRRKPLTTQTGDAPRRFEIVCDNCGKHDFVPFAPKVGRAVLCGECFGAKQTRSRRA